MLCLQDVIAEESDFERCDDCLRSIYTPRELSRFYYPNTYSKGARIHSDSWGSDSPVYDGLSAEVDKFSWDHKDFLPVFAAGNYGELSQQYLTTVTSPAVAKNCIAVGATLTSDQSPRSSRRNSIYTYEMELEIMAEGTATETRKSVIESFFLGFHSLLSKLLSLEIIWLVQIQDSGSVLWRLLVKPDQFAS